MYLSSLGTGAAVSVAGHLRPCPPGLAQTHELHAQQVEIIGSSDPETFPVQKKYHTQEFLRTIPHLRLRTPFNALLARLRSDCEFYASEFFRLQSYVRVHPPLITSSDCEGAGEVFVIRPQCSPVRDRAREEFFRTSKYLTVSSQLHLEAYVHEHQAVWTLSPTFRAERSDTPRHLSEFYMLEAELRTERLEDVMDVVEKLVRHIASSVEKSRVGQELMTTKSSHEQEEGESERRAQNLRVRFAGLKAAFWPRISYTQAISLLQSASDAGEASFQHPISWDAGLQLEHEKHLVSTVGQGKPVFVTDYPRHLKPFYMLPSLSSKNSRDSPSETVANFDLLLPQVAEVAGGSLREHRFGRLEAQMERHGLSAEKDGNLGWYLDLRRWGSVPHGGFGLGFDRLLCYLSGVESVRDVVGWPRWMGRCDG